MGGYSEQYEKYYSALTRNKSAYYPKNRINKETNRSGFLWAWSRKNYGNRIIMQLSVAIFLIIVFLGCKIYKNQYTIKFYNLSKTMINKSYDYKSVFEKVKSVDIQDIENMSIKVIEKIKIGFVGGRTIDEEIQSEYSLPVSSKKVYGNNKWDKSIDEALKLQVNENMDIKSCNDGRVKKIDNDKLGNYILIDHGRGIESKYYNLSDIYVNVGQSVEKDETIGEIKGDAVEPKTFYFEILYMGKTQDVYSYMAT
jgi:murein DD-endopeptidase MepM/ murein hydrolase activator NlpD